MIQREISEDQFIADTTSSILFCIKWRAGNQEILNTIQEKLRIYEGAKGAVAKVQRLDQLLEAAREVRAERGSKLQRALGKIIDEAREVRLDLTEGKEYVEYHEQLTKGKEVEKERQEREILGVPYSEASAEERNKRLARFKMEFAKPEYVAGIVGTMSEEEALRRLLANFVQRTDFSYIFSSGPWFTGRGDCGTLVSEYVEIAKQALGIKLGRGSLNETHIFIEGGGKIIHSDEKTGSIDNGAHWYFSSHVWAIWNGAPIDVLFGVFGGLKKAQTGTLDVPSRTWTFGDIKMYAKHPDWSTDPVFDRYTLDPEKAKPKVAILSK